MPLPNHTESTSMDELWNFFTSLCEGEEVLEHPHLNIILFSLHPVRERGRLQEVRVDTVYSGGQGHLCTFRFRSDGTVRVSCLTEWAAKLLPRSSSKKALSDYVDPRRNPTQLPVERIEYPSWNIGWRVLCQLIERQSKETVSWLQQIKKQLASA